MFANTLGILDSLPIGVVTATGSWSPALPYPILINLLSVLNSQYGVVAFRFIAQGSATWQIDDVYVDPYRKG